PAQLAWAASSTWGRRSSGRWLSASSIGANNISKQGQKRRIFGFRIITGAIHQKNEARAFQRHRHHELKLSILTTPGRAFRSAEKSLPALPLPRAHGPHRCRRDRYLPRPL